MSNGPFPVKVKVKSADSPAQRVASLANDPLGSGLTVMADETATLAVHPVPRSVTDEKAMVVERAGDVGKFHVNGEAFTASGEAAPV